MSFPAPDITRFSNEAEEIFAREFPCIVERTSLNIISGTSIYTLSDSIIDIRKVTWKGKRVSPISHRNYRKNFDTVSTGAAPERYIFNNIGQSQIKFFPIPNVNISVVTGLYSTGIPDGVIVEYYRAPDFSTYKIPDFFRDRLLNAYANKCCYAIETRTQNLKAAKYWEAQWILMKNLYGSILEEMINAPRSLIVGPILNKDTYLIPQPRLPYDMDAIDVDDF